MTWNEYTTGRGYYTQVWRKASPERVVKHFQDQLNSTPRYKIFKRILLRNEIRFWQSKIDN